MQRAIAALALALPATAFGGEVAFDCGTPDSARPELGAHLLKLDGADKGSITIGDERYEAMVLGGLGTITFLHLGDGYTMQYAVNPEAGIYDYSASGSRQGYRRGKCVRAAG